MRAALSIIVSLFAATVATGSPNNARLCADPHGDPEDRIKACTQLIEVQPDALSSINRGDAHRDAGNWTAAQSDYADALKREPKNVTALTRHAELLALQGNAKRAIAQIDAAIAIAPSAELYMLRGDLCLCEGDVLDAVADYTKGLALDPRNVALLLRRAKTYEARSDTAAARVDYDRAVEFSPTNPEVLVARAKFFKRSVRSEQALADLMQAIEVAPDYLPAYDERASFYALRGKHQLAVDDLTKVLSARPHDTDVLKRRMDAFLELRDSDRAIADGTRLVKATGGYDALLARGMAYLQKGGPALDLAQPDLEAAARVLRNADNAGLRLVYAIWETLYERPRPARLMKTVIVGLWRMQVDALGLSARSRIRRRMIADAEAYLGLLALKRNDMKMAASSFDAALAISTESATALYGRGVVKHQAGDIDGAKDDFVAARVHHPGVDHAFAVVGIEPVPETRIVMVAPTPESGIERDIALCDGREMTSQADGSIDFAPNIEGCNRALRGSIARAAKSRAYHMRAQWLKSTGDVAAAVVDVDAALAIEPHNVDALLARAALSVQARRFERAIGDFDQALKITPESFQALFGRCWARIEVRDVKGAVEDCDRAVELSGDPDVFTQRRAPILLRAGQYERARADYDRILRHLARQGLDADAYVLFGRGIARRKLGDTKGEDDLKAARKQHPGIDKEFAALGLTP